MARDWHEQFRIWSKPPTETEEGKGSNAASKIREAIRDSDKLASYDIEIYASGSYRNNTNVRLDSDIDIAVVLRDTVFFDLPNGVTKDDVGISVPPTYSFSDFREDVGAALRGHFGKNLVTTNDKTYELRETRTRLNADVTPFLLHRRYTGKKVNGSWHWLEGVELRPRSDSGKRVINWHQQHYDNGVSKNDATGRRYKRIVRILKKLKQDMIDNGSWDAKSAAKATPSFLIECLVYNAPDEKFNLSDGTYFEDVKAVIAWLFHQTKPGAASIDTLQEVSELKDLFAAAQPWTAEQAHAFMRQGWYHVGFENG